MSALLRVLVWGEYRHEKTNPKVGALYPEGMHEAIAAGLRGVKLKRIMSGLPVARHW